MDAADDAVKAGAFDRAVTMLRIARDLCGDAPVEVRIFVGQALARLQAQLGDAPEAIGTVRAVVRWFDEAGVDAAHRASLLASVAAALRERAPIPPSSRRS